MSLWDTIVRVTEGVATGGLSEVARGAANSGTLNKIVGGLTGQTQADAATKAAQIQANAANVENQDIMSMFNTTQGNLSPFRTTGTNALTTLSNMNPSNAASWEGPGYQFQMQQGENALSSQAAAAGNYGSGNMGNALQQFGQGLGANAYQQAWNNQFNLAGMGENAAAQTGTFGANAASTVGSNTIGAGQAMGTGVTSAAGYQTQGMQNLFNMFMSGIGTPTGSLAGNALSSGGGLAAEGGANAFFSLFPELFSV